jgi:hypothetical protein
MNQIDDYPDGPDRPERSNPLQAALGKSSLRAALVAFGAGVVWAALTHWRRTRPADPW